MEKMRMIGMFLLMILSVLLLCGCPEEKETINKLQYSTDYSEGISGGWFRIPGSTDIENSRFGFWEQTNKTTGVEERFVTTLYVVKNAIQSKYPNTTIPDYIYVSINRKEGEVEKSLYDQILKDLIEIKQDLNQDGNIDNLDADIVIQRAQKEMEVKVAAKDIRLLSLLKETPKSVGSNGKLIKAWAAIKTQ